MEPEVILEDSHFLFINKPAAFDSSIVKGGRELSVSSWLRDNVPAVKDFGYKPDDFGLLNRLDYETSGLLIAAKNMAARDAFLLQTKENAIEKRYLFVAEGMREEGETISVALGARDRSSNKVRAYLKPRKKDRALPAETLFTPVSICEKEDISFTLASIKQGRRHQIRAHAAFGGYHLVGDTLYGAQKSFNDLESPREYSTPFLLHSFEMEFTHPITKKNIVVKAPLPESFKALRKDLLWRDLLKNIFA